MSNPNRQILATGVRAISTVARRATTWALLVVVALPLAACDQQQSTPQAPTATAPATSAPVSPPTATQQAATTQLSPTAGAGGASTTNSYRNPVLKADFPDPFVLHVGGVYYAYATNGSGKNIQEATSTDLTKWEVLSDAMPALASWAKLGGSYVWAPEVIQVGDRYVMYYTARDKASNKQCVGVATSAKPDGKFKDTRDKPLVCQADQGGTIDPDPFRDGDKLYLYYKNDGNCCSMPTYLYMQELAADGLSLVGSPTQLVRNDKNWEGHVVEAPTMWKHDDKYYLFFSGNNYAGFEYAVGYANCQSAKGPCEDAPENPILKSVMQLPLVIGPGHQTIVQDEKGGTWIIYHAWEVTSAGTRGSSRFMWMDKLEWKDGKPVVDGPTTGPQPMP